MTLTPEQLCELSSDLGLLVEALRSSLEGSAEAARPVALDQQAVGRVSRIDAMQQQKMVEAHRHASRARLQLATAARRRVDEGAYGECVRCGEGVGYPRLKARPETPLCLGCQAARERG